VGAFFSFVFAAVAAGVPLGLGVEDEDVLVELPWPQPVAISAKALTRKNIFFIDPPKNKFWLSIPTDDHKDIPFCNACCR
jgi:hypothetical protein